MKKLLTTLLILVLIFGTGLVYAKNVGSITQKSGTALYAGLEWQVVSDSGELGSAVSSYTFSGLNGDVDQQYRLIYFNIQGDASDRTLDLRFNSDSGSNYGQQVIYGQNTTATAVRYTGTSIDLDYDSIAQNKIRFGDILIFAKSGYVRTVVGRFAEGITGTTIDKVEQFGGSWNNTADNITSINLISAGNGIGIGSRLILLARRQTGSEASTGKRYGSINVKGQLKVGTWQLVERKEVTGSAITSYTFSGLTGNTDVLYEVRARVVSGAAGCGTAIQLNGDTSTISGYQALYGASTTVTADRGTSGVNRFYLSYNTAAGANEVFQGTCLIYAKSGYVRTGLSEWSGKISTTTVTEAGVFGGVYNETSTEITSILVTGGVSNGLGVGTVLELWKLNLGN